MTYSLQIAEKTEILKLLKLQLQKKMSGTTTIPIDEAENLLASILYVLAFADRFSESYSTIEEKFIRGKQRIQAKLEDVEVLYRQTSEVWLQLPVTAYQNLLGEFRSFFSSYDIEFAAHLPGQLWIDYQLAFQVDDQKQKGIDFVSDYLERLLVENSFCCRFSENQLLELFQVYSCQQRLDYRIDVNNIYERVFFQAFGKWLLHLPLDQTLLFTDEEYNHLIEQSLSLSDEEREGSYISLLKKLGLTGNTYLKKMYRRFFSQLLDKKTGEDSRGLFIFKAKTQSVFMTKEGLLSKEFTKVVTASMELEGTDKINYLITHFSSLYDYLDFFELDILKEKEYLVLYGRLGMESVAVLLKFVLRNQYTEKLIVAEFIREPLKVAWQQGLQLYCEKLTPEKKRALEEYSEGFELPIIDFS